MPNDCEEVFENDVCDDFDQTVSDYLDELETQSSLVGSKVELPWSIDLTSSLDLDEYRLMLIDTSKKL